ncbi:hypothetical protein S245_001421, partial [Arachis hypogaea]
MAKDNGNKIPKGMPVIFQPTQDMERNGLHLVATAYIINTTLDQETRSFDFNVRLLHYTAIGRGPIPQTSISAIRKDFMGYVDEILTPK